IIVGAIGNLDPGKPEFLEYLDRFQRHPLFRGIRYGNLWERNLGAELAKPEFVSGLKALAAADLTLDTANPRPDLIEAVVRLTDRIPELRVVIDHLPQLDPPSEPAAAKAYGVKLRALPARPRVFVKVSEVLHRVNG